MSQETCAVGKALILSVLLVSVAASVPYLLGI
jgi:hypothetical protein